MMKKLVLLVSSLALLPALSRAANTELPVPILTAKGVRYYNGGVGIDERKALPQTYGLKIVLATDKGLYVNNAEILVRNAAGEERFRARADNGPWLVADLPPGTYTVEGTLEGRSAVRKGVSVKAGSRTIAILRWKTSEIDMGL